MTETFETTLSNGVKVKLKITVDKATRQVGRVTLKNPSAQKAKVQAWFGSKSDPEDAGKIQREFDDFLRVSRRKMELRARATIHFEPIKIPVYEISTGEENKGGAVDTNAECEDSSGSGCGAPESESNVGSAAQETGITGAPTIAANGETVAPSITPEVAGDARC